MHEKHRGNLTMYVNDVIGLERDVINAVEGQLKDERVTADVELVPVLRQIVVEAKSRLNRLQNLSEMEHGSFGAAVKETATAVTGVLAGIYGKFREHPVSRMVRDDLIAMNVTSTAYDMLYTTGLGIGHSECADIALTGVQSAPPIVIKLTELLPGIVLRELAGDAPLSNPGAEIIAAGAIRAAWSR